MRVPASPARQRVEESGKRRAADGDRALPVLAVPHDGGVASCAYRLAEADRDRAVAIVAPGYVGRPDGLRRAAAVLEAHDDVGLVTGWVRGAGRAIAMPCPAFPFQWIRNEAWPIAVLRARALLDAGPPRAGLQEPYATWDVVNAILAAGWKAVTFPGILASCVSESAPDRFDATAEAIGEVEMRRLVRSRFPDLIARDALALFSLLEESRQATNGNAGAGDRWVGISFSDIARLSLRDKVALAGASLKNPGRVAAWIRSRVREVRRPSELDSSGT
jgi:hypothetical protein